jgi:hypothetical protein
MCALPHPARAFSLILPLVPDGEDIMTRIAFLLGLLALASCRSMDGPGDLPSLPTLHGAAPAGAVTRLTGRLVQDGATLRLAGGGGTTVIVWPRNARAARDGGGTVIVVWPRGVGVGAPLRVGGEVEISGIVLVDNLPGLVAGCANPCTGPLVIVRDIRPLPGAVALPRLAPGAPQPAPTTRITATLVEDNGCLRAAMPGGGTVIVIWPFTATGRREGGPEGINGVVIWPAAIGTGRPVRTGQAVTLTGEMKDDMSGLALDRSLPATCRGRAFIVRDASPAQPTN